jgi:hypothetical protein
VVPEERRRVPTQVVPGSSDLDPPFAAARDLVGGPLADEPAVDPRHLDGAHVRDAVGVARHVEGEAVGAVLEDQSHRLQGTEDLEPERPHTEVLHVGTQSARQPDVVLLALVAQADEAVEDVVVLVEAHVRREAHQPVGVRGADVVPVVPRRVAVHPTSERLGDLVVRVLVGAEQHAGTLRAWAGEQPVSRGLRG